MGRTPTTPWRQLTPAEILFMRDPVARREYAKKHRDLLGEEAYIGSEFNDRFMRDKCERVKPKRVEY